ncbi:NUDIX domain-containing protein [Pseudonocardia sp. CA-107938]|uniref:NUDIX domain-containing protein n=1 Tax=Pseudonocardia sp. CA-107938 TaxID=3240021 RepID=UPI003D8C6DD3
MPERPFALDHRNHRDGHRAARCRAPRNERDKWELPGGRIEIGESPEDCVAREIAAETGWKVTTGPVLDTWMYYIDTVQRHVFIATYG